MKNKILSVLIIIIMMLSAVYLVSAKEYKVSIKQLPGLSDMFVKNVNTVLEATGNKAIIEIASPGKSEFLIISKKVDLEYPSIYITNMKKGADLKYDFSSVTLGKIPFVLYTNKDNPVDVEKIKKDHQTKFNIEVEPSLYGKIDYEFFQTTNMEASFKKLSVSKIDGYITVQATGDMYLKKSGLKNIKRQLWNEYDWTFSLPKGSKGGEVDKMLIEGINKLKASGKYSSLAGSESGYEEWQP
jgi:hypothetical protein